MKEQEVNPTILRLFLWSGVIVIVALIAAQGLMMGFVPGPSPALSAEEIKQIFIERKGMIQVGTVLQIIFWSFYATWAIPIIIFIRRMERGMPVLTYASLVNVGGGWVFFILIPMTWAVIAFRAETLDPAIIQIMNDWVWFDWLFTWPSFSIWMFIIAAAILMDRSGEGLYPRWAGWLNIWCGFLIFPAGLIVFFKSGPFAYDGLISFWFAVFVFFGWMASMTALSFRAVAIVERRQKGEAVGAPRSAPARVIAASGSL